MGTPDITQAEIASSQKFQGVLFKIVILLWIAWPGILAAFLKNESHDVLGQVLQRYFLHPPSIDNITNYWLIGDMIWRRIYVSAWCVNGYVLMFVYAGYLFRTNSWKIDLENKSPLKLIFLAIISMLLTYVFYSDWIFSPERHVSQKAGVLIYTDIGLLFLFPIVWLGASIFFISGFAYLSIVALKFFNITWGAK